MSELAKILARAEGIKPGKEYWLELVDYLRYEQIEDEELSAQKRKLYEIYAIADDVKVRVQILSTLAKLNEEDSQVYVVNRLLNDSEITHDEVDFVLDRFASLENPAKKVIYELKEGLDHELKKHVILKLLNSWGVELSDKKTELLEMLHESAEFFGRKKSRASKNKKQRMADLAEQSVIALAKFDFEENVEKDLRKLIDGENLHIRVYASDLLFRFNPVIAKDVLLKAYEHFSTRSLAKKFVEKYNQQCCVPVAQDEALAIAKSALSDELSKSEHFGIAPDEIDLIEEKKVNWLQTEKDVRTFFLGYQYKDESEVFPAAVKVFDAYSEKVEVHIFKTAGLFDFETDEIINMFVGKAYFEKHFTEIIPEETDDEEATKIEEFLQEHQEIFDSLYSPENLVLFKEQRTGEIYAGIQAYELQEIPQTAMVEQGEDDFNMELDLSDDDSLEENQDSEESEEGEEKPKINLGELINKAREKGIASTDTEYFEKKVDNNGEVQEFEIELDEDSPELQMETSDDDEEFEEDETVAFPAVVLISGGMFKWEDVSEYSDVTCEHMFFKHLGERIAEAIKANSEYNFKFG